MRWRVLFLVGCKREVVCVCVCVCVCVHLVKWIMESYTNGTHEDGECVATNRKAEATTRRTAGEQERM
mgnify:CR=1 FL=1